MVVFIFHHSKPFTCRVLRCYLSLMDSRDLAARLRNDLRLRKVWEMLGLSEVWVAGGWIRDTALGRPPADLDLVIGRDCGNGVERLAASLGLHVHRLGSGERSCLLISPAVNSSLFLGEGPGVAKIEIWELGDLSPEEDALRRDFSINAMLWRLPEGPLIDPSGGLEDLRSRRLRAVRRENLEADPVRLLRAPRFLAALPEFVLDELSSSWIRELAPSLSGAPRERVGAEFFRIASASRPRRGLEAAEAMNLLLHAGGVGESAKEVRISWEILGFLGKNNPVPSAVRKPMIFLSYLVSRWGITSAKVLARYSWPRSVAAVALEAAREISSARAEVHASWKERRIAIHRHGEAFSEVLALAAAVDINEGGDPLPWKRWWRQWKRSGSAIRKLQLPLGAGLIGELTGLEGPELGRAMKSYQKAVLRLEIRSLRGVKRWAESGKWNQ